MPRDWHTGAPQTGCPPGEGRVSLSPPPRSTEDHVFVSANLTDKKRTVLLAQSAFSSLVKLDLLLVYPSFVCPTSQHLRLLPKRAERKKWSRGQTLP